ncbi:MAG: exo-alpha-sialidase [Clostridia bacterium]|nr:exo-alpha-sialidase [Clostridia bacterium]
MRLLTKELIYPVDGGKTPQCHASTLIRLDGEIHAAWFGGTHEKADDVEIWHAVRKSDGWCEARMVSPGGNIACWNPVLYKEGKRVLLWYKRGAEIAGWQTFVRTLENGIWSDERELIPGDTSGGRGPVKNKPILLSDGVLIAGASHETPGGASWRVFFDRSSDGGGTWERTDYINDDSVKLIQPTLWESETGVHALLRSASGYIYRTDSADLGCTWSAPYPTSMPNNNSGIDLARMDDGTLALVCNPVGDNWGARSPISLYLSHDDGETWVKEMDLATRQQDGEGEFSYPAVIYEDGGLHITFTYKRRSVMYCRVEV